MNTSYLLKVKLDEIRNKRRWTMPKKTYAVVGVVVGLHCILVGSIFLMHGCGTPAIDANRDRDVLMPPNEVPLTPTLTPTVFKPVVKQDVPTPVETPAPVVKPDGAQNTYIVQKGDYLSTIASRFGVTTRELMEANSLKSADKIFEKQKLVLPAGASSKPLPPPAKKQAKAPVVAVAPAGVTPDGETDTYTVKNGDCLSKIAGRCKTTTQALRNRNKLSSDRIFVGQKLAVPKGSVSAEPVGQQAGVAPTAPVPAEPAAVSVPVIAPAPVEPPVTFITHDVQFGQTLDEVAAIYSVPVEKLMSVNNLKSKVLKQGMKLKIPQNG